MSPMIHTNKYLHRRTILRGLGAAIALPFLDAMTPAFAATPAQIRRLGIIYVPNGMCMQQWTPTAAGKDFSLTPILRPLTPFRDNMVLLTGLDNAEADGHPGDGGGDHSRSQAAFLTGVHAKKTEGADILNARSMDQIVAEQFGKQTQLASLEIGLEMNEIAGTGEDGYSAAYSGALAWRGPHDPLPVEADPRAVFERLFGASESTDRATMTARMRRNRSILDSVTNELNALNRNLGARDRSKVNEYMESIRDLERRIQRAEEQGERELPQVARPAGVPDTYEQHAYLMFDLMALSYQTDLTRVVTFLMGREKSGRAYPEAGVPDSHHSVSHHQNRPEIMEKVAKINTFHMKLFAHFLDRMKATEDGTGSLLDSSAILYGAGMADSDSHYHHNVPALLMGGAAGQIRGGRHIEVSKGTPLTNLHLTLLDRLGVPVEKLGDSTGRLELISQV
ncbi:MAG: DUF1552 domain-containing protein [Vicinamibacterales bacterium]